jgi:hypothetical protein
VYPRDATASSYLQSGYNRFDENYHPRYVLDDDSLTAWTEGEPAHGVGAWLQLHLQPMSPVQFVTVRLRSGYQKSARLLEANAAPQRLRVSFLDADSRVLFSHVMTLERTLGWQEEILATPQPVVISTVQLEVLSAHPGDTYPDLCISDVQLMVLDAVLDTAQQEAGQAAILAWIAERQAEASAGGGRPSAFAAHVFRPAEQERYRSGDDRSSEPARVQLGELDALYRSVLQDGVLLRGEAIQTPRVVRAYDEVEPSASEEAGQLDPLLGLEYLFELENLHLSPTETSWRSERRAGRVDRLNIEYTRSNLRVLHDADGQVVAIAGQLQFHNWGRMSGMGRGYEINGREFLLTYRDGQVDRLMTITNRSSLEAEGGSRFEQSLVRFSRDRRTRINGIDVTQISYGGVERSLYHPI